MRVNFLPRPRLYIWLACVGIVFYQSLLEYNMYHNAAASIPSDTIIHCPQYPSYSLEPQLPYRARGRVYQAALR